MCFIRTETQRVKTHWILSFTIFCHYTTVKKKFDINITNGLTVFMVFVKINCLKWLWDKCVAIAFSQLPEYSEHFIRARYKTASFAGNSAGVACVSYAEIDKRKEFLIEIDTFFERRTLCSRLLNLSQQLIFMLFSLNSCCPALIDQSNYQNYYSDYWPRNGDSGLCLADCTWITSCSS